MQVSEDLVSKVAEIVAEVHTAILARVSELPTVVELRVKRQAVAGGTNVHWVPTRIVASLRIHCPPWLLGLINGRLESTTGSYGQAPCPPSHASWSDAVRAIVLSCLDACTSGVEVPQAAARGHVTELARSACQQVADDVIDCDAIWPLPWLKSLAGAITLSDGVVVRRLTPHEEYRAAETIQPGNPGHLVGADLEHGLVLRFQVGRAAPMAVLPRQTEVADAFRTTVALLSVGVPVLPVLFAHPVAHAPLGKAGSTGSCEPAGLAMHHDGVDWTEKHAELLSDVFKRVDAKKAFQNHPAMRRLRWASERMRSVDTLVDLWVAAESLLGDENTTELKYRMTMRGAFLTATKDYKTFSKDFAKAYGARSKAVHGRSGKNLTDLSAAIAFVHQMVRNLLLRDLLDGLPVPDDVDAMIIGAAVGKRASTNEAPATGK
jgi:hypothetical protein